MYKPYNLSDVEQVPHRFNAISMFSGVGGGSLGVRLAGGKVLVASEFIPEARNAYLRNSPDTIVLSEDIRKLTGQDFLDASGLKKGEVDLVEASPPCSGFSTAGLRQEGWGVAKKYSSTSQIVDDLFFEFARVLKEIQPKFFISENVKGLLMGSAKHLLGSEQLGLFGDHEDTIFHALTNAGYKVRFNVLNSKNFGVPQSRERLIIVGVRDDIDFNYRYPKPTTRNYTTLSEAFYGIENTTNQLSDADISRFAIGKEALNLKPGEQSEKYFSLTKQRPDRYSDTLTASASTLSAASIIHWDSRKFTVPEAIRIMGFPDDIFVGNQYAHCIERLGRAITPVVYQKAITNLPL